MMTAPASDAREQPPRPAEHPRRRVVSSAELFRNARELVIVHGDEEYRLRITRASESNSPSPMHERATTRCTAGSFGSSERRLADLRARRDGRVGVEQDHLALLVVGAEHQHFRDERADLLRREVDDRDHAPADQLPGPIVGRDLGARALDAELAEVDPEPVRRTPRLRELHGVADDAHAHIDLLEVPPGDRHCSGAREPGRIGGWPETRRDPAPSRPPPLIPLSPARPEPPWVA